MMVIKPIFFWGVDKPIVMNFPLSSGMTLLLTVAQAQYKYNNMYIWLCLFLTGAVFSKGRKFDLCESYPRIIPQKITIMNVSFGIVWDCIGLTTVVLIDLTS